jgi:hypothetical protein
MPEAFRKKVISLSHDNHTSGHFQSLRTAKLISIDIYWLGLEHMACKYVASCKVCHQIKALRMIWS